MKFVHNIFITNSYLYGVRIALDIVINLEQYGKDDSAELFAEKITKIFGNDAPYTTHTLITDSDSWDTVIKNDTFFSDIKICKTQQTFFKHLKYNAVLTRYDIEFFVLAFTETYKPLIVNEIIAKAEELYSKKFNDQLYYVYKDDKRKVRKIKSAQKFKALIFDRILASDNGMEKFKIIAKAINEVTQKPVIF